MRKLLQYITFIFMIVSFSGCGTKLYYYGQDKTIENKYVSFKAPNKDYYSFWDKEELFLRNTIDIMNHTPKGAQYDITIHTDPAKLKFKYFRSDADYEKMTQEFNKKWESNYKERGVSYIHSQIQYVKGIKCECYVESQGVPAAMDSGVMKKYDLACGYYDSSEKENDGRRMLLIEYWFKYFPNNIRLAKDKGVPSSEIKSRDEYELEMKEQVKTLIDSLEIKNFDVERMKKEGLYHPNEKYEHMKW